jgi:hypothetical protein
MIIVNCIPFKLAPNEEKALIISYESEEVEYLESFERNMYFYTQKYYFYFKIGINYESLIKSLNTNNFIED